MDEPYNFDPLSCRREGEPHNYDLHLFAPQLCRLNLILLACWWPSNAKLNRGDDVRCLCLQTFQLSWLHQETPSLSCMDHHQWKTMWNLEIHKNLYRPTKICSVSKSKSKSPKIFFIQRWNLRKYMGLGPCRFANFDCDKMKFKHGIGWSWFALSNNNIQFSDRQRIALWIKKLCVPVGKKLSER